MKRNLLKLMLPGLKPDMSPIHVVHEPIADNFGSREHPKDVFAGGSGG